MSDIDTNSPEFKQAVAEAAKDAVAEATEGLRNKNAELLGKLKKAQKDSAIDPADLEAAERERDEWKDKAIAAEKAAKKAATDLETERKARGDIDAAYSNSIRDAALAEQLAKAGVTDPVLQKAAKALLGSGLQVVDENGTRVVKAGEVALDKHITEWAGSDEGKRFVTAPDHNGGGSQGGRGNPNPSGDKLPDIGDKAGRIAAIEARIAAAQE